MDKDIKLQLAINKMEGMACLAINIHSLLCPQNNLDKDSCEGCPYFNFIP